MKLETLEIKGSNNKVYATEPTTLHGSHNKDYLYGSYGDDVIHAGGRQ